MQTDGANSMYNLNSSTTAYHRGRNKLKPIEILSAFMAVIQYHSIYIYTNISLPEDVERGMRGGAVDLIGGHTETV